MKFHRNGACIELELPGSGRKYPIRDFTPEFLRWQLEDRRSTFQEIAHRDIVPSFAAHLPVVTTVNCEGAFPFHTSTKGVGLLPKEDRLEYYCGLFKDLLGESKERRVEVIQRFYNSDHIATDKLGLLEIFRGTSFRNIHANPLVSLQFTSPGPHYRSFQINGIAEIVEQPDLHFQFIYLARLLFECESFHIQHPEYRTGYVVWVSEVYDKAPHRGKAGKRLK